MSLKENIDMVKEELNSEEKFFEKAVVTERFVKKYKKPLIGAVVAIVLVVAADVGYTINKQNTIESANEALQALQSGKANSATQARLKSLSGALYDLWAYAQAIKDANIQKLQELQNSKTILIGDLAGYESASRQGELKALEEYTKRKDALYKDLATVEAAVLLMDAGKVSEAHGKLASISADSPLYAVVQSLKHYGVK